MVRHLKIMEILNSSEKVTCSLANETISLSGETLNFSSEASIKPSDKT